MKIDAIIIDGRHGGLLMSIEYKPTIKLPITNKDQISLGESYDNNVRIGDEIEYKECFRSVDKTTVLYSRDGKGYDVRYILSKFSPTYPVRLF